MAEFGFWGSRDLSFPMKAALASCGALGMFLHYHPTHCKEMTFDQGQGEKDLGQLQSDGIVKYWLPEQMVYRV